MLIAPARAHFHYSLLKKVEDGQVEWLKRDFVDEDLQSLGRNEVENIVDAVFVTLGGKNPLSMDYSIDSDFFFLQSQQVPIYLRSAADSVSQ